MCTDNLYKYTIFLLAWSIFFLGYFFRNCISPIVDVLEKDLNTTATGVGFIGSFIQLFYFSSQIPFGILLQFVPGYYVLPASSIALGIASFVFSYSTNVLYATITSSVAGFVLAPAWLSFVRIIDDLFTRQQVPFAIGVQMTLTYSGLFLGNFIQAEVYQNYGEWRIIFRIIGGICLFSGVSLIIVAQCNKQREQRLNPKPLMKNGREVSMSAHELKLLENGNTDKTRLLSKDSKIDLNYKSKLETLVTSFKRGFTLKWNWLLSIWGFCGLSMVNGFIGLWFISYLMTKFGYSRPTAALISGSFYIMRAVSAPIFGRLAMRFSRRKIFLTTSSCLWLCTLAIIYLFDGDVMMGFVIILNLISGIGAGSWGIMWALQREYNAYYECKDMAAGLVNTIMNSSSFVTQLFIGEMLDWRWEVRGGEIDEDDVRIYTVSDYNYALLILPVVVVIAIISAILLKETYGNNVDYSKKNKDETDNE